MKAVKMGLIGLGYIGKTHLKNSLKLDSTKVAAVADTSQQALKYAKEMGVLNLYTDYKEMVQKEDLDAVIVSLPNFLHRESIDVICESGKHILMEKPLARNSSEGKYVVDKVKSHDLKLMVGYPLRFTPYLIDAKEEIDSGNYGAIENIHAVRLGAGPFFHRDVDGYPVRVPEWWFSKERTGGGVLLDLGCHLINLLRWYFGDIAKISGSFGYKYGLEIEDQATCLVQFQNGIKGSFTVNWTSSYDLLKVDVHGTVASKTIYKKPISRPLLALQLLLGGSGEMTPHMKEVEYFADCILRDVDPEPSGLDGLKDLIAIDAAYNNTLNIFE